jgi:hypothetical protein
MFLPFPILPLVHHNSVCIFLFLIIYYVLLQLKTTCTLEDNHGANVSHGAIPVNVCLTLHPPNIHVHLFVPYLLAHMCL